MDYKYIEQLLDRYFQCDTTLEEEQILRTFFAQAEVPDALKQYAPLFVAQQQEKQENTLGSDFDERILSQIGETTPVKARTMSLGERLMPLFKAAAVVAIILTLGNAAQFSFRDKERSDDINYANYKETYDDPSVAYDQVEDALQLISEGINASATNDSAMTASQTLAQDSISKQ